MNNLYLSMVMILLLLACSGRGNHTSFPAIIDTLVIEHHECTECLDAYLLKGHITYPDSLKKMYNQQRDIMLAGSSPYEGEEIGNAIYDSEIVVTGFFYKVDTANAVGDVPVFYVINWEKQQKRKVN